ncbi:MAG: ribbon-helix-helix domain-containing protein [Alphaproteobacteria bacterium]
MIKKHSVLLFGHATSFSLEDEFWLELKQIAKQKQTSVLSLIKELDEKRQGNLSSAIRVFVLNELKKNS